MAQSATINDLDSQLLAARDLREQKKEKSWKDLSFTDAGQGFDQSWREQLTVARRIMATRMKRALAKKTLAPVKQGTSYLLKAAWINIIDSFGLTLIWINIHVFLRWVVGDKLFCRLGEEWLPPQVALAGGKEAETASKGIGLIETIVLLIVDFIVLMSILANLALIVIIVQFMQSSWWQKLVSSFEVFWAAGWVTIKALYQLFSS